MPLDEQALPKIDKLISLATNERDKHKVDDSYWGTESDIETSNKFFTDVGTLIGIDVAEDDEWSTYLLKATSIEAYDFAIVRLLELKDSLKT